MLVKAELAPLFVQDENVAPVGALAAPAVSFQKAALPESAKFVPAVTEVVCGDPLDPPTALEHEASEKPW
jgi:hypothetical protein